MGRFRRVLYVERSPWSSDRGFRCALEVTRAHGAALTVAAVAEDPGRDPAAALAPGAAERRRTVLRRCRARLDILSERGADRGVATGVRVLEGGRVEAVVEEVERGGHDLVMKVARDFDRASPPWPAVGVDPRLFRACPCPVWILNPAHGEDIGVVLAAVDVSGGRPRALNARIVRAAAAVAERAGADLHVVHAWTLVGEPVLTSSLSGVSRERVRSLLEATRTERRASVDLLVREEAPDRPVSVELMKGDAARVVRVAACSVEADVVVMGSSGRTGLSRLVWGSLAERMLGRLPSSLLVVKEDAPGGRERPRPAGVAASHRWTAAGERRA